MFHIRRTVSCRGLIGYSRYIVSRTNLGRTRNFSTNGALVTPFKLADIGEGIAEVELLKWYIKKG